MTPKELQERTLVFAVDVYRYARLLLRDLDTRYIGQQLIRAAASVAANYRAACLARTRAEWLSKMGIVREESDESLFWLVFIQRSGIAADRNAETSTLTTEADELVRIFAASYRTGKGRNGKGGPK